MKFKLMIVGALLSLGLAGRANAAFFVDTYDHASSKGSVHSETVGDFDNDGDLDFAIHYTADGSLFSSSGSSKIEIWLNNGSGGFTQGSVITTNFGAYDSEGYLNYADLSGDGIKDLVIGGHKSSGAVDVLVFTGDGVGGFGGSVNVINIGSPSVNSGYSWTYSLVDMNNDGKMDILLHGKSYLTKVTANMNTGGGIFTQVVNDYNALTAADAATNNGFNAISDVSQDITGDGFVDMVVVNVNSTTELIQVLAGDGSGGFTHLATTVMGTALDTGIFRGSIKVGDVNKDGIKDVVYSYQANAYSLAKYTSAEIRVVLGLGNGSFATTPTVLTGTGSDLGLTLNDIDADGDLDIVSPALSQSPSVGILLNTGFGSFTSPQTTNLSTRNAYSYRIADFDGNGLNDILVGTEAAFYQGLQFNVLLNGVTSSPRSNPVPFESTHPYTNNFTDEWRHLVSGNPVSIDVTFDERTSVESDYDYIYIYDSQDVQVAGSPFTGSALVGAIVTVPGNAVRIRLATDGAVVEWGFKVTAVTASTNTGSGITGYTNNSLAGAADNNALGADTAAGGCVLPVPMTLNVLLMLLLISLVARYRKLS